MMVHAVQELSQILDIYPSTPFPLLTTNTTTTTTTHTHTVVVSQKIICYVTRKSDSVIVNSKSDSLRKNDVRCIFS